MDAGRLELTGPAVPLLEDVSFEPGTGTAEYAFSRSGIFAYVTTNAEDRKRPIAVIDEKGNQQLLPVPPGRYGRPRVSPDGTRLAVTTEEGGAASIWIYEWATQRFTRFPFTAGGSENPLWTPDSKHLLFSSEDATSGPGIYLMRADGGGAPERLIEGRRLLPWSLTSDAARLLYQVSSGPNAGLWVLPLDWTDAAHPKPGAAEKRLNNVRGDDTAFSPDARWIANTSGVTGLPEVLVRPFPGPGGSTQISSGGGTPVWSRAARRLFYQAIPGYHIMAADYGVAGDSFSPSQPRVWNKTRVVIQGFDLMPDGKRIVAIPMADQKEPTHAAFLLNFIDGFGRR
jgi:Tol biopolymer transport system component